jgi:hypothetical protein
MKRSRNKSTATANLATTTKGDVIIEARAETAKIETVEERPDVSRVLVPSHDISARMLSENTIKDEGSKSQEIQGPPIYT